MTNLTNPPKLETSRPTDTERPRLTIRAMLMGDRIDTGGLERPDMIASAPFAIRVGDRGFAALFRYGVVVLAGLSPVEEDDFLRMLAPRISGSLPRLDQEVATMEATAEREDQVPPGGPIQVRDLAPERFLVVADALAKSVAMAHYERQVSAVFDVIDPLARDLAREGRLPNDRKRILKIIGEALLVDHRMSGRVAVEDKPDVLWDRSDLERLYARLEDEYELSERARTLARKIAVVQETARALTDLIDAKRSARLEATIVLLIVIEVIMGLVQFKMGSGH
jgi:uncharacterized Rmd1/YagE family protein